MRVDAHQHFLFPSREHYPWLSGESLRPLMRDFAPAELEGELRRCGVDHTVLVQTKPSVTETQAFLRLAGQTPFVAGVVGWVDLTAPDVGGGLDKLLGSGAGRWLVGVRHQPDGAAWLLRADVNLGLRALAERGLTYDLLLQPGDLDSAVTVARRHPALTFVLDHAGNPDIVRGTFAAWHAAMRRVAACPNIFVKLSGLVTQADWVAWTPPDLAPYLNACLELFTPARCLFGSDWPVCLLAADYGEVVTCVRQAASTWSEEDRAQLWGETADRVYRLSARHGA